MKKLTPLAFVVVVCTLVSGEARATCPATPTLISPIGGTTVSFGNVELKWAAASGATAYELFMGLDGDTPGSIATVAGTTRNVAIDPGRDVKWKIYAKNVSCAAGTPSAIGEFSTSCPTTPPTLRDPDKNSTFSPGDNITFRWTAVAGAASYDVNVTPDFGQTWQILKEFVEGTSFTTNDIEAGNWGWNVRANFDSCDPLYSEPSNFFVVDCPTGAPELTQPDAGEVGVKNPVEFRWNGVDGATKYRVYVSIDGGARTLAGETTSTKLLVTLSGTEVYWQVEAVTEKCSTLLSSIRRFTLADSGACPSNPGKATLTSPAAGASNLSSPVTFKWNAVSGATGYRVWALFSTSSEGTPLGFTTDTDLTADVPAGSGVWFVQTFFGESCPTTLSDRRALTVTTGAQCENTRPQLEYPPNGAADVDSPVEFRWNAVKDATKYSLWIAPQSTEFSFYGTTEETKLARLVPDGSIEWFVVAHFSACPDVTSSIWSFQAGSAGTCPAGEIQLQSPSSDVTVSSPAHLSWSAVSGVEEYRVWVSVDGDAPVPIIRTSNTQADVNLPAGEIVWYVEGRSGDCPPIVSDKGRFNVSRGANCDTNPAPALVAPVGTVNDPALVESSPVTFTWTAAAGAIGYRVWIGFEDEPFGDADITQTTTSTVDLEPGRYRWYVEALFSGCPSVSSAVSHFRLLESESRCTTEPPALVVPGNGDQLTSPVSFSWTEVEKTVKYRLFVSRDGADPVLLGATTETSLQRSLPPGTYVWSVEAVLEECPSLFSAKKSFIVAESANCTGEAPQLVSPADGTTELTSPVTFIWNPVNGAVKYILFLRAGEGAATAVGSTTSTSISRTVPPGKLEWWVVAVFAGCEPEKSEQFTLTVQRSHCDHAKPILLTPDDDDVTVSPVRLAWTTVPEATGYKVWAWRGDDEPAIVASTAETAAAVDLTVGGYHWYVEALFTDPPLTDPPQLCPSTRSAKAEFVVGPTVPCGTPRKPVAKVVGKTASGNEYRVRWTPLPNVELYELQESASLDFSNAETITTGQISHVFSHEVANGPVQYLYRVRGVSNCNDALGPYSNVVGTFVFPPSGSSASAEVGTGSPVVQKLFLPGGSTPVQFMATADKPWITITPSSGTLPLEGITLTISADPDVLDLGTNTASISIVYSGAGKGPQANEATTTTIPLSVSLVTPVEPGGKGTPSPDSLIFPVVAHVNGANNSFFESDVRLTNLTAETMKYDIHFTPSGETGTVSGSASTIEVEPGATIALDDVLSSFFGEGTTAGAFGTLEVRPQTTSEGSGDDLFSALTADAIRRLDTAASSRTYTFTPSGTYGQFIPAIPYADFVGGAAEGAPATILSLQQVAESAAYRANFGFAEASGNPADLITRVYDAAGTLLATIPVSLAASQHQQLNGMLSANGIHDLDDGRVEVEVVGGTGKVTAYVSEVDNSTNDPLLVSAMPKGSISSNRYVVPGAGYVNNGSAFWVTDLRVFNTGSASTTATLTFHPMKTSPGTTESREITLAPGEIEVINNVLGDLFAQPNGAAGSVAITTPSTTTLMATARTYNQTTNGTYGQYIPGVTPAQSIGLGDRALQILQVEQSSRFRTNIGLAETSGAPATVEVMGFVPDSLVTAVTTVPLAANEFFQFPLSYMGLGDSVYNARVSVRVIDGAGRITAYGSAIDAVTQDPTYVPAQ